MQASSPNTTSNSMLHTAVRTGTPPPVPEDSAAPLKRKADEVFPNPDASDPPARAPATLRDRNAYEGSCAAMAITLDSSDDEGTTDMDDTVAAPRATVTKAACDVPSATSASSTLPPAAYAFVHGQLPSSNDSPTPAPLAPAAAPPQIPPPNAGPTQPHEISAVTAGTAKQGGTSTPTAAQAPVALAPVSAMPPQIPLQSAGTTQRCAGGTASNGASDSFKLGDIASTGSNSSGGTRIRGGKPTESCSSLQTGVISGSTTGINGGIHGSQGVASPKSKRKAGRPMGRKNRPSASDPPYVAPGLQQSVSGFVPNVATRPKRQPGPRMRWADEMANPGEQWLRKEPALLPNPVDATIPEAPTFHPTVQEFRDPLSYIESIRPIAEGFGIAKIVPPAGWNPPTTALGEHINKLIPTKKQALHSLMNSDEVYDEGREFTLYEYKVMADHFESKWSKREPPPGLKRRAPRRVKNEPQPNVKVDSPATVAPVSSAATVKMEGGQEALGSSISHVQTMSTPAAAAAIAAAAAAAGAPAGTALHQTMPSSSPVQQTTVGASRVKDETPSLAVGSSPRSSLADFPEERLLTLEREYWNVVDGGAEEVEVEYANDLDISEFWSGFPMPPADYMDGSSFDRTKPCNFNDSEYYRTCGWNLNNLPFWPGSVLRFFRTHVNGLTAPWLYLGMQYATFAWHNEDNYLYSLNYHHSGAPKQWYGVPGSYAKGFETCLARILGETLDTVSEHLYRITKMLSPVYLQKDKVPVCRLTQDPGQFVVTFPKAYHGGFSYGMNCGEAVNFAVPDWISYSRESAEAYRQAGRTGALSHDKMVATLTMYLPDHDVKGCELVLRELKRIQMEELQGRRSLELQGAEDPSKSGLRLPKFKLGLIEQDTEEYDERRVCKTCKHTLFLTGVACRCNDTDVSCLRCAQDGCGCAISRRYLLSWWTEHDLSKFVFTAEAYLKKLMAGQADEAAIASFRANIDPF